MVKSMFIRTERLFLRPAWPEDIDDLQALVRDDPVARNMASNAAPGAVQGMPGLLSNPPQHRLPNLFVYVRSDGGPKLVGGIGLARDGDDVELSYWIAREHRGHGYAGEAVEAVLEQAQLLGHRQVVASHFSDNEASARVLEGAGFTATGETRSRFSAWRGAEAPARLYVAVLAGKALYTMRQAMRSVRPTGWPA